MAKSVDCVIIFQDSRQLHLPCICFQVTSVPLATDWLSTSKCKYIARSWLGSIEGQINCFAAFYGCEVECILVLNAVFTVWRFSCHSTIVQPLCYQQLFNVLLYHNIRIYAWLKKAMNKIWLQWAFLGQRKLVYYYYCDPDVIVHCRILSVSE